MFELGPFVLQHRIGRGGMGEVWRATHQEQQEPVAIKILTKFREHKQHSLSAFRDEVRAVAGLNHPGIVQVLDYGELAGPYTVGPDDTLPAGSPYLVMELADGSLEHWKGNLPWRALRKVMLSLLDALAHAHARGVIHRDLKPGNVLISRRSRKIKLADFGIAYDLGKEEQGTKTDKISGTLAYMAPEQFEREIHHYGPWTDLYAFGCLVYAMVSGDPPFGTKGTLMEMMFQHLCDPIPPLKAFIELPEGFDEWLLRLLEKAPSNRYQRAADAAWGLLQLGALHDQEERGDDELFKIFEKKSGDPSSGAFLGAVHAPGQTMPSGPLPALQTLVDEFLQTSLERPLAEQTLLESSLPQSRQYSELQDNDEDPMEQTILESHSALPAVSKDNTPQELPPFPEDWRRRATVFRPLRLEGVGLGLYGVRSIPLVGRERERDILWEALHKIRSRLQMRTLLLRGPSGYGKSRLAEWLLQRAHEVGTAHILKAVHSPILGPSDGLIPMFARFFRCAGMPHLQIQEHLPEILHRHGIDDPEEVNAIVELILSHFASRELQTHKARVHFGSEQERYVLIQRLLQHLTKTRPVLVWLDDVHWSINSLGFVQHLLGTLNHLDVPIMLLLTVREEALVERIEETALLDEIMEIDRTYRVEVGPLAQEDRPTLIRELLGLEGEVAALVEERTAGNPLFAVQLVGDWVQRGLLEHGQEGFRLKPGTQISLPDDMHSVWAARLERLFQDRPQHDRMALELAAVLGQEVDGEEWREVCKQRQLSPPYSLVEALIEGRLALAETSPRIGWSFVHGMLRESLTRQADEAGRLKDHNLACAQMLRNKKGNEIKERIARHLLVAGKYQEALSPLHKGIKTRLQVGQFRLAKSLLADWEPLLETLQLPPTNVYWGERSLIRSAISTHAARYDDAKKWARLAEQQAREHDWPHILAETLFTLSKLAWNEGQADESFSTLEEAEQIALSIDDQALLAKARAAIGDLLGRHGRLEEARPWLEQARDDFEELGDTLGLGNSYRSLCNISRQSGEFDKAALAIEKAQHNFELSGARESIADCLNLRGEIARMQGDLANAEHLYRAALKRLRALESLAAGVAELNLGLTLLQLQRHHEARPILEDCTEHFLRKGRPLLRSVAQLCLIPCLFEAEEWTEAEAQLLSDSITLSKANYIDVDVANSAQLAGDIARKKGMPDLAKKAYRFALMQWKALGRLDEARAIQKSLTGLTT